MTFFPFYTHCIFSNCCLYFNSFFICSTHTKKIAKSRKKNKMNKNKKKEIKKTLLPWPTAKWRYKCIYKFILLFLHLCSGSVLPRPVFLPLSPLLLFCSWLLLFFLNLLFYLKISLGLSRVSLSLSAVFLTTFRLS